VKSGAASYLNNPLLKIGSTWYNFRLLGPQLIVLIPLALVEYVRNRRAFTEPHHIIGISFIIAVLPFFLLLGRTISRHLLVVLVPTIYLSLIAFDKFELEETFLQATLVVSILVLLVNL
jgi:hypothetical protein